MKDELLASILSLSPAERVRIAQAIWESVDEIPNSNELSEEQRVELSRRIAEFDANGSQGRPWREVLSDISK